MSQQQHMASTQGASLGNAGSLHLTDAQLLMNQSRHASKMVMPGASTSGLQIG